MTDIDELKKHIPLTETAFLVLLAMVKKNHGYGVLQMIDELTQGRVKFGPGTLYGAINNLSKKGWIELVNVDEENRRKEYIVTPTGRKLVFVELERMKNIVEEGYRIVGKEDDLL